MKKLFLFIICAVLSIGARAQFSGSGNGTEADPYRIYTDIHLAQMANFLNQEGVVFELMKDVDLSSYISENSPSQGWTPIGVESTPFKGVLKGNGHTIRGMVVNRPSTDNIGLFGYINGASITDVNLEGKSIIGRHYVGGIVGTSYGNCTISNCNVVMSGQIAGLCDIGGIVGFNHETSTIRNCNVKSNISSSGSVELTWGSVGGLCGTAQNTNIADCYFEGQVSGKIRGTGGLFGSIGNATVTNVNGKGNVVGETLTGGIAGNAHMTNTFKNVRYTGDVEGTESVSGGVGRLESCSSNSFNNCHHKGTISNSGDYIGGIVGKSEGACIAGMESCSHFGDIEGKSYVGGIIGAVLNIAATPTLHTYYLSSSKTTNSKYQGPFYDRIENGSSKTNSINNCTAIGNVYGSQYVGGMIGKDEVTTGYTSSSKKESTTDYYIWIDGVYNGGNWAYVYTTTYTKSITNIHLTNSFYSGNINGKSNVGGLIGHKEGGCITNCYTYATIAGESNIGGLVGTATGSVVNSSSFSLALKSNVAINTSITATSSNVGRIFGNKGNAVTIGALGSAESNRALTQTKVMLCGVAQDVVDDEQNGTSVGPSMLRLKANYVSWGWNFDDNWNILETECYPYKKYQAAPPVIKSTLQSQDTNISGQSVNGGTVYMYYKDRDAVSTDCDGYNWAFTTEALQSGAQVQLYADVDGMTPSYLASATVKYPGSGREDDPYRIYSAEDLQCATNSGYYKLMNDIDLTSWINKNSPETGWTAVGRNSTVATYINGDGHKVTGLWINTTAGYNGLFSNYSAGYIKNLNVEVASGKKVKGGNYTGILIGRMANGQIINCSVKGDVEGTVNVGGVAGHITNSSVSNSAFEGKVNTAASNAYAGGVTGLADNVETTSCRVNATITTAGEGSCVGGLYGKTNNGSVTKSTADAKITASGASNYVGGLVGRLTSPVTLCYSTGTVTASGNDSYTGGLVGYAEASIANSYSTANVSGTQFTAGLVSYTFSIVDKCYASGNVAGVRYGAGLVGELDGTNASVTNSVAANNKLELTAQSAWGCRVIGGFKNGCAEPNNSNYALTTMQVSLNNVPQKKIDDTIEGIAKTESELKSASTYSALGWDMTDIWTIDESKHYPTLGICDDAEDKKDEEEEKEPETPTNPEIGSSNNFDGTYEGVHYVDLGLPSGLLWATCNVGADKPEAYGDYFAWGETSPKDVYNDDTYIYMKEDRSAYEDIGSNISGTEYDAATANLGGAWRMPTRDEWDELTRKTTHEMVTVNGIAGFRLTGTNGNSIFIPSAGTHGEYGPWRVGENIDYWTSTVGTGWYAYYGQSLFGFSISMLTRYYGMSIRPVVSASDINLTGDNDKEDEDENESTIPEIGSLNEFDGTYEGAHYVDLGLPSGLLWATCNVGTDKPEAYGDYFAWGETETRLFPYQHNDVEVVPEADDISGTQYDAATMNIGGKWRTATQQEMQELVDNSKVTWVTCNGVTGCKVEGRNGNCIFLPASSYAYKDIFENKNYYPDLGITARYMSSTIQRLSNPWPYVLYFSSTEFKLGNWGADYGYVVRPVVSASDINLTGGNDKEDNNNEDKEDDEIPDTDISQIANTIYVEKTEAAAGSEFTLSVKMKNDIQATGFQFNLYLPEGISVVQDEDGFCDVTLSTTRTTAMKTNTFDSGVQRDGSLLVLAASTKNYAFSGNDGEVCTITIKVDDDVDDGDYPIILKSVCLTNTQGQTWEEEFLKSTLTISSYTLGDVNADGKINVGDFSAIASHIMGITPAGFVEKAADINNDTKINVGDLSAVVSLIMNGGAASAKVRSANTVAQENSIFAHAVSAAPGDEVDLVINLNNSDAVTAMQFDMCLPEGMSIVENGTSLSAVRASHTNTFDYGMMADNKFRVLAASTTNALIDGNDGEIVRIRVRIDESVSDGEYPVIIRNAEVADNAGRSFLCADKSSLISVSGCVTGIDELSSGTSAVYYDLNGISDTKMHNGINIIRSADGTMKKVNKKQF